MSIIWRTNESGEKYLVCNGQHYYENLNQYECRYFTRGMHHVFTKLHQYIDDPQFTYDAIQNNGLSTSDRAAMNNFEWENICRHLFIFTDPLYTLQVQIFNEEEGNTIRGYIVAKSLRAVRNILSVYSDCSDQQHVQDKIGKVKDLTHKVLKVFQTKVMYQEAYQRDRDWIGTRVWDELKADHAFDDWNEAEIARIKRRTGMIGMELYNVLDTHSSIFRYSVNHRGGISKRVKKLQESLEEQFGSMWYTQVHSLRQCSSCSTTTICTHKSHSTVNHNDVCHECWSKYYRQCVLCGEWKHRFQMNDYDKDMWKQWNEHNPKQKVDVKSHYVCSHCAEGKIQRCGSCEKQMWSFTGKRFDYQREAVVICPNCVDSIDKPIPCAVHGCHGKVDLIYRKMIANHNDWYFSNGNSINRNSILTLCDKHVSMLRPIAPHFLKPAVRHKHKVRKEILKPESLLIGFELEFEAADSDIPALMAQVVKEKYGLGKYTVVSDGSLSNGAEIVSNPLSFLYYKKHRKEYKQMLKIMHSAQCRTHGVNIGLHIHASKDAFSSSQIFRLAKLLSNVNDYRLLSPLFGRGTGTYNRIASEDRDSLARVGKTKRNYDNNHYNVFNLSNNTTVEFRMFAGPRHHEDFFAFIECVFAFWEWSLRVSNKNATAENFLSFIRNNKLYPFLAKRLRVLENVEEDAEITNPDFIVEDDEEIYDPDFDDDEDEDEPEEDEDW